MYRQAGLHTHVKGPVVHVRLWNSKITQHVLNLSVYKPFKLDAKRKKKDITFRFSPKPVRNWTNIAGEHSWEYSANIVGS